MIEKGYSSSLEQDDVRTSSPLFTPSPSPEPALRRCSVAEMTCPDIPGLFYLCDIFTHQESYEIVEQISRCGYFDVRQGRDQAVIFGSHSIGGDGRTTTTKDDEGVPEWTQTMLRILQKRLFDRRLPQDAFDVLFAPHRQAGMLGGAYTRQLILNTYSPGQGIASHIDIPHRFLDGIMIISFGSGISMDFEHAKTAKKASVYLMPNSVCILTGESRWEWSHGIDARTFDRVNVVAERSRVENRERGQRLSVTVRWLKIQQENDTHHDQRDLRR